jgi:type I restriction enzyme S subunit
MEVKPDFKMTEVGMIPGDWEVKPLGALISSLEAGVSVNSVAKEKDVYAHNESILKTSCVIGGTFLPEEHKTIIPRDIHRARLNPCKDSIVISRMNTPALVGECGYVDRDYPNLFLPDRLWMTRHHSQTPHCVRWLAYLLGFSSFNRAIKETATGTSGSMKNISKESLLAIQISLPTKAEQETIAEALSDADSLIESLEQLIAKKRNLKHGAMQELLRPKDGWVVKELQEISEIDPESLGVNTRPSYAFKYISLEDVDRGMLLGWSEEIFSTAPSRARRKVKKGDVLISTVRPNLQSHYLIEIDWNDLICSTGFSAVRCRPCVAEPRYVFECFFSSAIERQIEAIVTGSNYPAINSSDVKRLKIPVPPTFSEQTAIATILSDMDAEIAALEAKLAKSRGIKQGMMQELLTGRTRLI